MLVYTLAYRNVGSGPATGLTITETVPVSTRFHAADSSPGWSCADQSPPGTVCTLAVPDLAAGASATRFYAVRVDLQPTALTITNQVRIADAEGGTGDGDDTTIIGRPAPAPALAPWALAAALTALALVARRARRRA